MDEADRALREQLLQGVMAQRGCDEEEGNVILARIADRLGGYSHGEVKQMHPLPVPPASASLVTGKEDDDD